jgi:anhydro-N-acetylmuramic acid kinase
MHTLGLMSGTSLDGVDAALVETDGHRILCCGESCYVPYTAAEQEQIRAVIAGKGDEQAVAEMITRVHIKAVKQLLAHQQVDVIGFHGQTIWHKPQEGKTCQIGNATLLAKETGVKVVYDFRSNDMRHGGQGAPLVPLYHRALVAERQKPVAIINIGGVANITYIGKQESDMLAFDTGTGNALLNDWVKQHTGALYDKDGEIGAKGKVDQEALESLLDHAYFAAKPPKSLDRNDFSHSPVSALSLEDGAATLTAFTVEGIIRAMEHCPEAPHALYITGGGRLNPTLMRMIKARVGIPVEPIEALGANGDVLEAQAFGYLAARSLLGLPLTLPSTTGVKEPVTGGEVVG